MIGAMPANRPEPFEPKAHCLRTGRVLRDARLGSGLSYRALAARLGISVETMRAAERGRPPRHSTLMAYLEEQNRGRTCGW